MSLPRTLGELRHSPFSEERLRVRRVKDELRDNLSVRLREPAMGAMVLTWTPFFLPSMASVWAKPWRPSLAML
jgi:hypothetical protein